MGKIINRIIGVVLIIAGLAGIGFSTAGLVILTQVEQNTTAVLTNGLDVTDRALTATADGLNVANGSLDRAHLTLTSLVTTTRSVGVAIKGSLPAISSINTLIGEDIPNTLSATETTIRSVAAEVEVIDQILPLITSLPVLGLNQYQIKEPLAPSFEQMADDLKDLPASLRKVRDDVNTSARKLEQMGSTVDEVADNIARIEGSLLDAQTVIGQYQEVVQDLQQQITTLRADLPRWLSAVRWAISLVLIWLGIAQLGLLTQGAELISRSRATPPGKIEP